MCAHTCNSDLDDTACNHGDVRLVDGTIASEGRVEVCHGGHWLGVCDRDWSRHQAADVCTWLGLGAQGEKKEHITSPALRVARETGRGRCDDGCTDQIPLPFVVMFVRCPGCSNWLLCYGKKSFSVIWYQLHWNRRQCSGVQHCRSSCL